MWEVHAIDGTPCSWEGCPRVARWKDGDRFACKHHKAELVEQEHRDEPDRDATAAPYSHLTLAFEAEAIWIRCGVGDCGWDVCLGMFPELTHVIEAAKRHPEHL